MAYPRYLTRSLGILLLLYGLCSCCLLSRKLSVKPYRSLAQFVDELQHHMDRHRDEYLAVQWISADSFLRVVVVPEVNIDRSKRCLSDPVLDTLSLHSVWSLIDPKVVVGGVAYLQDYDSVWYEWSLRGPYDQEPHPLDSSDCTLPIRAFLASPKPLRAFYLGQMVAPYFFVYDPDGTRLRVYDSYPPYEELPVDSLLEDQVLRPIRLRVTSGRKDIRREKRLPMIYVY